MPQATEPIPLHLDSISRQEDREISFHFSISLSLTFRTLEDQTALLLYRVEYRAIAGSQYYEVDLQTFHRHL